MTAAVTDRIQAAMDQTQVAMDLIQVVTDRILAGTDTTATAMDQSQVATDPTAMVMARITTTMEAAAQITTTMAAAAQMTTTIRRAMVLAIKKDTCNSCTLLKGCICLLQATEIIELVKDKVQKGITKLLFSGVRSECKLK